MVAAVALASCDDIQAVSMTSKTSMCGGGAGHVQAGELQYPSSAALNHLA